MNSAPRALLLVLVLTASSLVGLLPLSASATPLGTPHVSPLRVAPGMPGSTVAPVHPAIHIRPSILPCNTNPQWPIWGNVGDGFLITPGIAHQSGCGGTLYAAQDEVHA